jgi:hypothetical protein
MNVINEVINLSLLLKKLIAGFFGSNYSCAFEFDADSNSNL